MEHTENTEGTAILGQAASAGDESLGGELVCPYCSATISAGERYCPDCGFERGSMSSEGSAFQESGEGAVLELVAGEERFVLAEGELVLGRTEGDVTIANPYLSRTHLRLRVAEGRLFVTDLGSTNGTFVDGARLAANEETELQASSELKAGELPLEFKWIEPVAAVSASEEPSVEETASAGSEPPAMEEPADAEAAMKEEEIEKAEVDTGETVESGLAEISSNWQLIRGDDVYPLPFGEIRVGRKPERNDIAFPDDGYISGQHLLIESDLDHVKVKDLNSTNGTFIGGRKIEPDTWIEVTPGVEIRTGQTKLTIDRAAPPVEAVEETAAPSEPESVDESAPEAPEEGEAAEEAESSED